MWAEPVPANLGPFRFGPYDVANSMSIYTGDPVAITNVTSSQNRMRKVIQDDIDDLWQVSSVNAGFAGFASYDVGTDSSGNPTAVASPVALSGSVAVILPVPSIAALEAVDPVSGRLTMSILGTENWMQGSLWENTTVIPTLVGTPVGILISTISGAPPTFFWSSAATTKIGTIVAVDESDTYFNTAVSANVQDTTHNNRCPVAVRINGSFNQLATGLVYDD